MSYKWPLFLIFTHQNSVYSTPTAHMCYIIRSPHYLTATYIVLLQAVDGRMESFIATENNYKRYQKIHDHVLIIRCGKYDKPAHIYIYIYLFIYCIINSVAFCVFRPPTVAIFREGSLRDILHRTSK
jgi:hypothetical protein